MNQQARFNREVFEALNAVSAALDELYAMVRFCTERIGELEARMKGEE